MHNIWLVARHAYRQVVGRRAFLILTLAIPLGMAALIAIAILVSGSDESELPLGYVDPSGKLVEARQFELPDPEDRSQIRAFPDEEAGLEALEMEELQALFVLPVNYPGTASSTLYYLDAPPGGDAWEDFNDFLRLNLAASYPDEVSERLYDGPEITVIDLESGRSFADAELINVILPFVAAFLFFLSTMSASGSMLQAVAQEKENRTMEVLLTSLTPGQLVAGKALGLLAAALTQLGIYVIAIAAGLVLAAPRVPELASATVPWAYLGVTALFFLPTFTLISAVMIALGAAVTELQQGQQVAGLLNLLFMLPLFLLVFLFENPGAPPFVALTLFPPTAFLTIALRWGLGIIPLWQLAASWGLLVLSTVGMLWAAGRIFRAGMLRYGQPLNLKSALEALRGGRAGASLAGK